MTEDNASENPPQNGEPKAPTPEDERRRDRRFAIGDCSLRHKKAGLLSRIRVYSQEQAPLVNVSVGGLQFLTNARLLVDQKVHLLVSIPGEDEPLALRGKIVWEARGTDTHSSRMGVAFNRGSQETWRTLRVLERACSPEAGEHKQPTT